MIRIPTAERISTARTSRKSEGVLMFRFALPLFVSLALLLAACGSDDSAADGESASPTASAVEATATSQSNTPTATTEASPTSIATASSTTSPSESPTKPPAAEADAPYQLVATWGEPALLVQPADVAAHPDGGLIVADRMRGRLVQIDPDGSATKLWDGLSGRGQVAVDGNGVIYAQSNREHGLVKLDANGKRLGTLEFVTSTFHLSDIAAGPDGYAYAISGESRSGTSTPPPLRGVFVFDPASERVAEWAAPLAYHPHAIAVGPDGTVYVSAIVKDADQSVPDDDVLIRFERDAYHPNDWIESQIETPRQMMIGALTVAPDGTLYILQETIQPTDEPPTPALLRLNPTGEVTAEWTIDDFSRLPYASANGIAASDGSVYVADEYNHRVLKLDGEGNVQNEYRGGGPGTLSVPTGIEVGPDGHVYVVDNALQQVTWFQPDGQAAGNVTMPGEYHGFDSVYPPDLAVGASGTIWISQRTMPHVAALSPDGDIVHAWDLLMLDRGTDRPLQFQPDSIALTADGTILVALASGPVILEYTSAGELLREWPLSKNVGQQFLTVTVMGTERYVLTTLVDDTSNNTAVQVQRLRDDGTYDVITTIPLRDAAGNQLVSFPADIAVDPDGNIFLADLLDRQVLKLGPNGDELARWSLEGAVDRPGWMISVAVDRDGRVYVADAELQQVWVYAPAE
jgi:sugar lactone lactonase YvrE